MSTAVLRNGGLATLMLTMLVLGAVPHSAQAMYDAKHGRWMQRDPLALLPSANKPSGIRQAQRPPDGDNLYAYGKQAPTTHLDPDGLVAIFPGGRLNSMGSCGEYDLDFMIVRSGKEKKTCPNGGFFAQLVIRITSIQRCCSPDVQKYEEVFYEGWPVGKEAVVDRAHRGPLPCTSGSHITLTEAKYFCYEPGVVDPGTLTGGPYQDKFMSSFSEPAWWTSEAEGGGIRMVEAQWRCCESCMPWFVSWFVPDFYTLYHKP